MALDTEKRAYEAKRQDLERTSQGKFVVFHGDELVGIFDDFDTAGSEAVAKFGDSASLILKIGESKHNSISILRT